MKCRCDGCTNEAVDPYTVCAECAEEIGYEPEDGPIKIEDVESENDDE